MSDKTEQQIKAEVLSDLADNWQWGGWSNVLLPKKVTVLSQAQAVTDWLRNEANKAEEAAQ